MATLTEETKQTLRVEANGTVFVELLSVVKKGDLVVGSTKHVDTLTPGSDTSRFSPDVQAICSTLWTPEVVAAYAAAQAAAAEL